MDPAYNSLSLTSDDAVQLASRGRVAQSVVADWSQSKVDQAVAAAGWHCYCDEVAERLSKMAVSETRYGKYNDTLSRYKSRILGIMRDLHGVSTVGLIESDVNRGITVFAKPVGLIAAMTPSTACASAIVVNALSMLKTRNAVIFSPNPRARRTAIETVDVLRGALKQIGGPLDVFQCISEPSRDASIELTRHVDLIVAAGGQRAVERAFASGVPAYGGGTGNSVVVVDDTADISAAARLIVDGKSFDNGTSCSSESSVVASHCIVDSLIEAMEDCGAYMCSQLDLQKLRKLVWSDGKSVSRDIVGQDAITIARLANINIPATTRVLMGFPEGEPGTDLMSYEKLSPILALWAYEEPFDTAIKIVEKLISCSGRGHSCAIHTRARDRVYHLADNIKVGRVMVNQSTSFGNAGSFYNGMPFSSTLSCGTWAGSVTTENINWRHYMNYTRVSEAINGAHPNPEKFFADHWDKYGR